MSWHKCARGCSLTQSQWKGWTRGSQGDFGSPVSKILTCRQIEEQSNISELTTEETLYQNLHTDKG